MKYSVSINEKKRTITVTLADGTKGVARCCPTDNFNIQTGVELALERAKTAKTAKPASVMELVKALEAVLPEGQMVIVGKGEEMTEAQKEWLRSLAGGCSCKCHNEATENEGGKYYTEDEIEGIREESYNKGYDEGLDDGRDDGRSEGYDDGYDDGYDQAKADCRDIEEQRDEYHATLKIILSELEEIGIA